MPRVALSVAVGMVGFTLGLACHPGPPQASPPLVGGVSAARIDNGNYTPLVVSHLTLDGDVIPVSSERRGTGRTVRVDLDVNGRHLTVWARE